MAYGTCYHWEYGTYNFYWEKYIGKTRILRDMPDHIDGIIF